MKIQNKKMYQIPTIKVVEFVVEGGFGPSDGLEKLQRVSGGSTDDNGWTTDGISTSNGGSESETRYF